MAHDLNPVSQMKSAHPPVKKNAFVYKLFDMLCNPDLKHLIWWTDTPDSNTFALYPSKEFADALSGYFKHGNVALFVRQLHMYGFHKVLDLLAVTHLVKDVWEFRHLSGKFRKNDELLLVYIKRRLLLNLRNPVLENDLLHPTPLLPQYAGPVAVYAPPARPASHTHHPYSQPPSAPHHPAPHHPASLHAPHHLAPTPLPGSPAIPQMFSPAPAHAPHPYMMSSTPPGLYMPAPTSTPPAMYAPPALGPTSAPVSQQLPAVALTSHGVAPRYMLPPPAGHRQPLWQPLAGPVLAPTSDTLLHFRGPWDTPGLSRPRNPSLRFDPLAPDDRALTRSLLPVTASAPRKETRYDPLVPNASRSLDASMRSLASSLRTLELSVRTLESSLRMLASSVRTLTTSVRTLLYGSISHLLDPDSSAIGPRDAVSPPPAKRVRTALLFLLHDDAPAKPAQGENA